MAGGVLEGWNVNIVGRAAADTKLEGFGLGEFGSKVFAGFVEVGILGSPEDAQTAVDEGVIMPMLDVGINVGVVGIICPGEGNMSAQHLGKVE